jgi:hypothetical protein
LTCENADYPPIRGNTRAYPFPGQTVANRNKCGQNVATRTNSDLEVPMLAELPDFMTCAQVAELLCRSEHALAADRYWRRGLPYHKVGQRVLYAKTDVLDYLTAGRVEPVSA